MLNLCLQYLFLKMVCVLGVAGSGGGTLLIMEGAKFLNNPPLSAWVPPRSFEPSPAGYGL